MLARHGIHPAWANEALDDPDRLVITPDPASKSGRAARTIGWSYTANRIITVITLVDNGRLHGVNGWVQTAVTRGSTGRRTEMSELEKLLREEAEHAEQNKDATPSGDAKIGRPGRDRAKVLSVRLNAKEYEQLAAQAELAGVGPSTLARSMILNVLIPSKDHAPIDQWVASVSERLSTLEARIGAEGSD